MSSPAIEDLRQQIGLLGARPFHNQVVQSPWNQVIDAEFLKRQRIVLLLFRHEQFEPSFQPFLGALQIFDHAAAITVGKLQPRQLQFLQLFAEEFLLRTVSFNIAQALKFDAERLEFLVETPC